MSNGRKINQPSSSGKNLEVIEFLSDFQSFEDCQGIVIDHLRYSMSLLNKRSKGHGSGCTTALSEMNRYLHRVLSDTAHLLMQ